MKDNKEMLNVKVGNEFIRINEEDIKKQGIEIEKTDAKVNFNHKIEDLYIGTSIDESIKIYKLMDQEINKYVSYKLNDYIVDGKEVPSSLYEYLNFMIEKKQGEVEFDAMDTPFTTKEITTLCKDYIYDYSNRPMNDYISEFADEQVNIYYGDIYANAAKFAEWTDEAIAKFGLPENPKLYKILQMGEYNAYSDALYKNIDEMGLYCSLKNSKDWLKENKDLIDKIETYLTSEERLELITNIEERIEEVASEYVNDNYEMGEYIEGTIEGAFENGASLEEKYEAIQSVMDGDDIKHWNVLNNNLENKIIVNQNDKGNKEKSSVSNRINNLKNDIKSNSINDKKILNKNNSIEI